MHLISGRLAERYDGRKYRWRGMDGWYGQGRDEIPLFGGGWKCDHVFEMDGEGRPFYLGS